MTRLLNLDFGLLASALFLIVAGLTTIFSIDSTLFIKQLIWASLAVLLIFLLPLINLKSIFGYRFFILGGYFLILVLLILTLFIAPAIHGTRGWLVLGPIQIQPAEFMKAALIILFSSFFASRHVSIARFDTLAISFLYFIVPTVFTLLQPDLGTALVFMAIWFSYLLISEIPLRHLIRFFLAFIVGVVLIWNFGLVDYQKARVVGFLNPNSDPLGANYNVIQSKIAVGSSGFFGKGFGQGSQVQLKFLPAAHTDFIFPSFTEQWGILGAGILISAFTFLVYRILKVGEKSDNNFSKFLSLGTAILLLTHFALNLGSALGLLPVVGLSLPLVSYGGSNLLTVALLLGIILNTAERRAGF
ncbi:MAG: FtsW/RodA/SpoVE family cell cycle protein [Candidatus Colwellbacteria bacterium]|nr:FtsW/RodA/SpoVE family cell cycle protein [Candidatus Colwellbacteria bacterium]